MTSLFKECGILLVHPGAQIVDVPVGNRRQPLKARIAKHLVQASQNLALDSSPEPWAPCPMLSSPLQIETHDTWSPS